MASPINKIDEQIEKLRVQESRLLEKRAALEQEAAEQAERDRQERVLLAAQKVRGSVSQAESEYKAAETAAQSALV